MFKVSKLLQNYFIFMTCFEQYNTKVLKSLKHIEVDCFKLYPWKHTTGSYRCNALRSKVEKQVIECCVFSCHVTKETFKINLYFAFIGKRFILSDILQGMWQKLYGIYIKEVQVLIE